MKKVKKALIWSLIKNERHPSLTMDEKPIFNAMPILDGLFPGIYYYIDVPLPSVDHYPPSGLHRVIKTYGIPALKKLFPEVENLHHSQISKNDMLEITEPFLKSKGYEWRDDQNWKKNFDSLLATELNKG